MAQGSSTLQRLKNQIKVISSVFCLFVSCALRMKCFMLGTEEGMKVGSVQPWVTGRRFLE
jgi:hypothetical protein